jgi:hypothetical protein
MFDDDPEFDSDAMVCPECGSEFQPHVLTCIDCGAATVSAASMAGRTLPGPAPSLGDRFSLPRASEAVCAQSRDLEGAEGLGIFLERHGVSCRIEAVEPAEGASARERHHPLFRVCVAPGDVARTVELEKKYDQIQIRATGMRFQELPPQGWCPACGTEAGEDAEWCPECGLRIGGDSPVDGGAPEEDSG